MENAQDVAGGGELLILGPELASVSQVSPPAIVVSWAGLGTRTTPYYLYLDTAATLLPCQGNSFHAATKDLRMINCRLVRL